MKRFIRYFIVLLVISISIFALTACDIGGNKTVTISFNTNGGSVIAPITLKTGNSVTLPSNPTKEGFFFAGWYTDESFSDEYSEGALSADITLYAKWSETPIVSQATAIVFNTNGGSEVAPIAVERGAAIKLPNNPTKTYYKFEGWYLDDTLTKKLNDATSLPSSVILYAKWGPTDELSDYTYSINKNGVIISKYTGTSTSVVIPSCVVEVGSDVFAGHSEIKEVSIPDSVKSIGSGALSGCSGLTTLVIPDSVNFIGEGVLSGCSGLTSITVPFIGSGKYNSSLATLFPMQDAILGYFFGSESYDGGAQIPQMCFMGSQNLSDNYKSFYFPIFLKSVTVTTQDGVLSGAFNNGVFLTEINLPNGMEKIHCITFEGCSNLVTLAIPGSVTSIGSEAFYGCVGLTSITIPDSVTSIGSDAFGNTAWYDNQPDGLVYAGKVAYTYKGTMPANTSITLKSDTKGIADGAFYGCKGLTSITIPDSVTSIGSRAFDGCTGLTSIIIPNGVTSIGWDVFDGCSNLTAIKCRAESQPTGWDESWLGNCKATVVWGYTGD